MQLERPEDVQAETAILRDIATEWGYKWGRLGTFSSYDGYLLDDKANLVAIVEVKRKGRDRDSYPWVYLDLDKLLVLFMAEMALQIPAYFFVGFNDGLAYVRVAAMPVNSFRIRFTGRTDRPEAANDQKPAVSIPAQYFRWHWEKGGIDTDTTE